MAKDVIAESRLTGGIIRTATAGAVLWSIALGISLSWNLARERHQMLHLVRKEARANFNKDQAFRLWAASHGGVYVPADERTPPNPNLAHLPERDIFTSSGTHLTLMNPAYMMRQVMADFGDLYAIQGHVTSLKPLNPDNTPDEWERAALLAFERGTQEVFEVSNIDGEPYLRLMRPMIATEDCLKCHAHQGYQVGSIRGGVGVAVPLAPYLPTQRTIMWILASTHAGLWGLGLFGIGMVARRSGWRARERAAAALMESEARFRAMTEHTTDLTVIVDAEDRVSYFNPAAIECLGYAAADALGAHIYDVVHPEDRPAVRETFERCKVQPQETFPLARFRARHSEGRWIFLEGHCTGMHDVPGVGGAVVHCRDITERATSEARLARTARSYADLTTIAQALHADLPLHQKLALATEETVARFGADFARVWILGPGDRCAAECMHAAMPANSPHACRDREHCLHLVASSGRYRHLDGQAHGRVPVGAYKIGGIAAGTEARFLTNDVQHDPRVHDPEWATALGLQAFAGYRLAKTGGEVLGVFALFTNAPISEEVDAALGALAEMLSHVIAAAQARDALRESVHRFRLHVEQTPVGVLAFDLDGRITEWNPAAEGIFGFTREEALARRGVDLFVPADLRAEVGSIWTHLKDGTGTSHSVNENVTKDGRRIRCEWFNTPLIDAEGHVTGAASMVQDITERTRLEREQRRLEAQVQHAQKLESLGVLAGGIAHDFNNLLTGILGGAELACMDVPPGAPLRTHLEGIRSAALHAAELTRQMLAYSGRGRLVVEPLDLGRLVEEIAHLLAASIPKNVIVKRHFAPDLPAVEADAAQMRQVIMNLIMNAGEAIGDDAGIVTVSTGVVAADAAYLSETYMDDRLPPGPYVYLEVADTGVGMDRATLAKIFEPFYTTKFQGRGLGLAAVLGIVRGHKGGIKVHSEPGRGTTFTILLPPAHRPANVTAADASGNGASWRGSGTVLVVDDEPHVRRTAARMLTRLGFTVLTADNGEQGVEEFRRHADEIAFVLLDVTMPHMNGLDAFNEMRRIRPDTRVILSSGYNEQEATNQFAGQGLAGFVQKPYQVQTLVDVARTALES